MTETRALDEPLTDAELDELEAFLDRPTRCRRTAWTSRCSMDISRPSCRARKQMQPSEWLPQVWSEGGRSSTPAFTGNEQAQSNTVL